MRFFPLGEGGALWRDDGRQIWCLNAPSAVLWCLLGDGTGRGALARGLAERFSVEPARADRDVAEVLDRFEREGLLLDSTAPAAPEFDPAPPEPEPGPPLVEPRSWAFEASFLVAGRRLGLRCDDAGLGRAFARAAAHLGAEPGEPADADLAVAGAADGGWEVYLDGRRVGAALPRGQVLPQLFALAFDRACRWLEDRLLLHAAVVVRDGRALMLPAETGRGKTTLAAAFAARGWTLYSDELAVLAPPDLAVHPFPMPLGVKQGSAGALERFFPGLAARPYSLRADGKRVHYLCPPAASLPPAGAAAPVAVIAFPRFEAGAPARLTPLDAPAALERLVATGSSERPLTAADVGTLVGLADGVPCVDLAFGDLGAAVAAVEGLWAGTCR
ncbi:MAG: PqqD family peptide modification chaperone [Deferrisomatales bacterium]